MGGIGPEATGLFYNKFIRLLQERGVINSNKDYPHIIINSIPAPELIYDAISDEDLKDYVAGLKELDSLNVDFIVMVCNTIHLFYEKLQKQIKTPILDLRKAMKSALYKNKVSKVTVMGTSSTVKKGLYDFEGIRCLNPSDNEISRLMAAIFNFNKGIEKEKQVTAVKKVCEKYLKKGSEFIILGCTEFATMLAKEHFQKIDTIDVLVELTADAFEKIR